MGYILGKLLWVFAYLLILFCFQIRTVFKVWKDDRGDTPANGMIFTLIKEDAATATFKSYGNLITRAIIPLTRKNIRTNR